MKIIVLRDTTFHLPGKPVIKCVASPHAQFVPDWVVNTQTWVVGSACGNLRDEASDTTTKPQPTGNPLTGNSFTDNPFTDNPPIDVEILEPALVTPNKKRTNKS